MERVYLNEWKPTIYSIKIFCILLDSAAVGILQGTMNKKVKNLFLVQIKKKLRYVKI